MYKKRCNVQTMLIQIQIQIQRGLLTDKVTTTKRTTAHIKEADIRSHSQTYIYTHLSLLLVPLKRHQSAACSEPYERAIDAVFMCVTLLYACSVGACGRNNRGKGLSAGLYIPNLLLRAKGGVSDNRDGNFRQSNVRSELHHFVRMPLFL